MGYKLFHYSGKLIWYCWAIIIIGLLHYDPIKHLIVDNIGKELFLYLLYASPLLLWGMALRFHAWGIGSSVTILLLSAYLIYDGLFVLQNTWKFFGPVFSSKDILYIYETVTNQKAIDLFYSTTGILGVVSIIGSIIHFNKHKLSFPFSLNKELHKKIKHQNPFGSAKLATPAAIKKYASKNGLLIGLLPKSDIDTSNLDKSIEKLRSQKTGSLIKLSSEHAVVIAPTRSGKGIGIIVPNLLEHDGGIFVLDPKAELACITKRYRQSQGKKVYVFDPKNKTGLSNCQINILDYLSENEGSLCSDIKELAKLICPTPLNASASVSHFIDSGRGCIELMLLYMFFIKNDMERNLGTLYDMLTMNASEFSAMLKAASESKQANGAIARAANSILSTAAGELSGVLSTARNALSFIDEPTIRKVTQTSNIFAKDFCDDSVDFFLCSELNQDGTANKMTQLLTNMVFKIIKEDRNQTSHLDRLMVLDELPSLGYLGFVSQALVLGAGYGIKILAIFQSMEKLKSTYPKDWQTFLESSLTIFMNCKAEAAKYVSDVIGTTTISVESESLGTSQQSVYGQINSNTSEQSGITQSSTKRNLLTSEEIKGFGKNIIIAFYEDCLPIVCCRLNYWVL